MIKIDLKEFISSGNFGPVTLEITKNEVVSLLGKPRLDSSEFYGSILLYSWYEFFFDEEDILYVIQNHKSDPESFKFKNDKVRIDSKFINKILNKTVDEVTNFLTFSGIEFEIIDFFGRIAIKSKSGVILDFDKKESKNGRVEFIGIEHRSRIC